MKSDSELPPPSNGLALPDAALALLRIAFALLMLKHGLPKLLHFAERSATFPDPLGVGPTASLLLAIFGEVICSLLLIPGVFVRLAAIPYSITMAVALFVVHANDAFERKELALVYLVGGLVLLVGGGGRYSVDARLLPALRRR